MFYYEKIIKIFGDPTHAQKARGSLDIWFIGVLEHEVQFEWIQSLNYVVESGLLIGTYKKFSCIAYATH